ncbi:MAG TPA: alpha-glucuronidase family glycosyl hydrolase [Terracidiphilus sp.]
MRLKKIDFLVGSFLAAALAGNSAMAQTADQAWLRYSRSHAQTAIPRNVLALGHGILEQSAVVELERAIASPAAVTSSTASGALAGATIMGTAREIHQAYPNVSVPTGIEPEGYCVYHAESQSHPLLVIAGGDDRGVLYGAFALLRLIATNQNLTHLNLCSNPAFNIRWVDEWDNPDGSIERGYAGRSIFFEGGNVREDLAPVAEYGRLLASIGINGLNVNNVNAAPQLIDSAHLKQIARVADALRPWGVHLAMSVAIASPQSIGGLKTYDPLDPAVKAWWTAKANEIYTLIPDFAGFTVKADSEGQPGPSSFGRTPADAANTLAAALAPHNGVVLYRAFVYDHHLDWRNPKADRARAAYDIFHPLDGHFLPNVIVQTKEGPIDFQVREPISPLFAGLHHTSQAMEVQITQEYTGQQRHLVYLAPMWQWVLDTDLHANNQSTPVKQILAGKSFHQPLGGMVGVAGIGRDRWLNSPLALANLYAFGRLAWNPNLTAAQIAEEWTRQTIGDDPQVVSTVDKMLMQSWPAYEAYTGPLGLQTLTDITGSHYGPNIESSERNGWGQWHDADHLGLGMDRTVATGTGFTGQYPPQIAALYENLATTPDDLLLFFHHVPYSWKLHNGKSVIQYLYDSHYDGAAQAAQFVADWTLLKPKIDPSLYADVRARLEYQAGHAVVWRDAIVQYFLKLSGIPDDTGRAGHYPGRLEAEDARLTGYKVIAVTPWEDASRGKAVSCPLLATQAAGQPGAEGGGGFNPRAKLPESRGASAPDSGETCTAEWTWVLPAAHYNIAVQYFDLHGGAASFTLLINNHAEATWKADANLPSIRPNGDNSTCRTIENIALNPGDRIRIEGAPDGSDPAAVDYIEITPLRDNATVPSSH